MFNSSSLVELRSYVNYTYFDIFLTELRQFIQLYGECYQQYPTLLNEISDWNVTANLNSAQDVLHGPSFELEIEVSVNLRVILPRLYDLKRTYCWQIINLYTLYSSVHNGMNVSTTHPRQKDEVNHALKLQN